MQLHKKLHMDTKATATKFKVLQPTKISYNRVFHGCKNNNI